MKIYILYFIFTILANLCIANTPHLYALHINGVNTTKNEAKENTAALKKIAQVDSNMVIFSTIWNPTGPDAAQTTVSNISDVITQKAQENQSIMSIDDFTDYYIAQHSAQYSPRIYHRGTPQYQDLQKQLYNEYYAKLKTIAGKNFETIIDEFHQEVPPQFADVVKLLEANPNTHYDKSSYPKTINLNQLQIFKNVKNLENQTIPLDYSKSLDFVLLIPHSQGNLYANSLHDYLVKTERIGRKHIAIYGIATPASENQGDWLLHFIKPFFSDTYSYITSSNDFVINTARQAFPSPMFKEILPANITIPFIHSADWGAGHNLIKVYLNDDKAKAQIAKMIHLELFFLSMIIPYDLRANNFILEVGAQEWGGGLVGPTGIVCLEKVCDPRVSYFAENKYESTTLDNYWSIMSFVPIEYFPEGEYFTLETQVEYNHSIWATKNGTLEVSVSTVSCSYDPNSSCYGGSNVQQLPAIFSYGINPKYFNLFGPDYFWNGWFIAQKAYVN